MRAARLVGPRQFELLDAEMPTLGFSLEGTLRDDRWAADRFIDSYLLARVNA